MAEHMTGTEGGEMGRTYTDNLKTRGSMKSIFKDGSIDNSKLVLTQTQAHKDDLEKMEDLEHRYHILEKALKEDQKGVAETVILMAFDVVRSIPLSSILAILPTLAGARLLMGEVKYLGKKSERDFLVPVLLNAFFERCPMINTTTLSFAAVVACGLAVAAAFPATGASRDYIFGHQAKGSCMWCLQMLAGPLVFTIVGAALAVIFVGLFYLMVDRMLSGFAMVWIMEGACLAESSKAGVAEALAYYMQQSNSADMLSRLDKFCTHFGTTKEQLRPFDERLSSFLTGAVLIVIGVVGQLSMHATNYEKVMMQEDLDEEEEREAIQAYFAHNGHHYGAA